ncbi:16934_t:CDS:2, partial [Racocetra persica]
LSGDLKYGLCQDCCQENSSNDWCQSCNAERFTKSFSNWSSGNKQIDMFIQNAQVNASDHYEVIEWIPQDELTKVTFIANGKYSSNYKAIWTKGDILSWNHDKNDWFRFRGSINNDWTYSQNSNGSGLTGRLVSLKSFQDPSDIISEIEKNDDMLLPLFGITQHPKTLEYMVVTSYAEG